MRPLQALLRLTLHSTQGIDDHEVYSARLDDLLERIPSLAAVRGAHHQEVVAVYAKLRGPRCIKLALDQDDSTIHAQLLGILDSSQSQYTGLADIRLAVQSHCVAERPAANTQRIVQS